MVKVIDYSRTATFAWSQDRLPFLVTGTIANTIDADFSSDSKLELWSINQLDTKTPLFELNVDSKFNDLDWSVDNINIAGALDNGNIELFNFDNKSQTIKSLGNLSDSNKHKGSVKTLKFNTKQSNLLVSGSDKNGEILIWDLNNLDKTPLTPGMPMTPTNEITSLAWNKSLSHVFSCSSNTSNVSIFDLKAKKEVIHLNYTNPVNNVKSLFSVVEWHPKNSTRIATATLNNDSTESDSIFIWDLRNSHTPLQILSKDGHSNGILSLDWCSTDENLLLSSGRDNSVMLWNPENGESLTKYPSRRNWCFKTKFAPAFPDVFATASFDGKIEVQTLQDLVNNLDKEVDASKKNESETDFWNNVSSETTTEKPTVFGLQAPNWYGNKSAAANWAFGGKLVSIGKDGKSISITKPNLPGYFQENTILDEALKSKDFNPIINQRLVKPISESNEEDWNLLEKLSLDGKDEFLKEAFTFDDDESENADDEQQKDQLEGEDFFGKLENSFEPTGKFNLSDDMHKKICKDLIKGNTKQAVLASLEKDYLLEALVIALDSDDQALKDSVKHSYFAQYGKKSPLSRFLYSISNHNVEDLVQNFEIGEWKYIIKSIYKFYGNDAAKRDELLVKLGNRLLDNGNRQDALTVYLAANSLDNVAEVWLKEFSSNEAKIKESKDSQYEAHTECLTEFVERFTVFSRFVGAGSKITNEDLISKFLEFVNLTSASGSFELAYKFLETLPGDNEEVNTEKERVVIASGKTFNKQQQPRASKYGSLMNSQVPETFNASPSFGGQTPLHKTVSNQTFQPSYGVPLPQSVSPVVSSPAVQATIPPAANAYATAAHGGNVGQVTGSKYAPPPALAPAIGGPSSTSRPTGQTQYQAFQSPANPYATTVPPTQPVFAQLNANPPANDTASIPPPPITNVKSGQTPHLNKDANDGWNDLPLKSKEKPSRAKPVAVSPAASVSPNQQPQMGGSFLPPPPLSRTASNIAHPGASLAHGKTPRNPSIGTPKIPLNPYAPSMSNVSSGSATPASNPYAPPTNLQQVDGNLSLNQYSSSGGNAFAPPPPAAKTPVGPPPINARKKSHAESAVANAGDLLSSIQSKSQDFISQPPLPTSSPSAPVAAAVPDSAVSAPPKTSTGAPVSAPPATSQPIPAEQQAIVDYFNAEVERVSSLIPKEYAKQLKDCKKRLKILFEHLEKQDLLTQPTIDKLSTLISYLKENKYIEAMETHVDIATNHAQEGGNWLTGVKRLIGIVEATSTN
ncbi:hypothetical protein Kpol_1019p30 [Vanderwaltozyma polyspora DSM 70294]|uniref:Protein transport protein SEC31 n=1 Tax=Vanderwaltozyma polyspora (strain ATCC 22028 / DSM 70294 / BCRC 21397 / CBS 2163 / NBRC 10782 / NRRL Y-8283 / UCD 57-17) TaxID=436907 RepID=A7TPC2_VANPO|nr:uncharacterized protein Kpol_1019p30 [Vanderwaltozyma polyspora DSM 70294]EDO15909.1 hypothetical protein Kpol_1019p30 [Vanderwaltozyma polyspora DSM 70294]